MNRGAKTPSVIRRELPVLEEQARAWPPAVRRTPAVLAALEALEALEARHVPLGTMEIHVPSIRVSTESSRMYQRQMEQHATMAIRARKMKFVRQIRAFRKYLFVIPGKHVRQACARPRVKGRLWPLRSSSI
jgi:hypothetical protein